MQILQFLMIIILIADMGLMSFNAKTAYKHQDWLWFGFSLLSIGLLIVAFIIFIGGLINEY